MTDVREPDLTGQKGTYSTTGPTVDLDGAVLTNCARTVSQALADGVIASGDTLFVWLKESATIQAVWECTFTDAATDTLTRVTERYITGTFTNGATVDVEVINVPQPGLAQFNYSTDANTTAALNARTRLDISGFSANRNVALPVPGKVGDMIEVFIATGDDTYAAIILGAATVTINGGAAATEWSRLFITGEAVRLIASSLTNWDIVHDGRTPCACRLARSTAQTIANTAVDPIEHNTQSFDIGDIGVVSSGVGVSGRITIRRAGKGFITHAAPVTGATTPWTDGDAVNSRINKNGTIFRICQDTWGGSSYAGTINYLTGTHPETVAVGDYFEHDAYQNSGGTNPTAATSFQEPFLAFTEVFDR